MTQSDAELFLGSMLKSYEKLLDIVNQSFQIQNEYAKEYKKLIESIQNLDARIQIIERRKI